MYSDGYKEPLYPSLPYTLSGVISSTNYISLDTINQRLVVTARDTGHTDIWVTVNFCGESYTAATSVDVLLSTIHPTFQSTSYVGSIAENSAIGSDVLTIVANVTTSSLRAELIYSIYPLNDYFIVNAYTGVINTNVNFDYESGPKVCQFNTCQLSRFFDIF